LLIHHTIEVLPFALGLDVGLIESPPVPGSFLLLLEGILQLRRIMNHLALDGTVIDLEATFLHDLFDIAIAQ